MEGKQCKLQIRTDKTMENTQNGKQEEYKRYLVLVLNSFEREPTV